MLSECGRATFKNWLKDCEKIDKGSMTMGKILHEKGKGEVVDSLRELK